jgi:hypothetical protein
MKHRRHGNELEHKSASYLGQRVQSLQSDTNISGLMDAVLNDLHSAINLVQ